MARFGERFLLGFTSPRSPYLIPEYIRVIESNELDGRVYNGKFQSTFYEVLSNAKVAGEEAGTAKDKAFAGRDKLTRMPQALGFFITQNNKPFRITDAGKLLNDDDLFEDILLHQMLKYQLPSKLHQESATNKGMFRIKPFLEIFRLIYDLEYLTYKELLIFGMTLTDYRNFDKTVKSIQKYRMKRKELKQQSQSLKIFDHNTQLEVFKSLYHDIIEDGNISTRESITDTAEKFMKKKMNNWADYTDSIFRLLRSSGMISYTKGRSLSINPLRKVEVEYFLQNVKREIEPINITRQQFDLYISNPSIPILYSDKREYLLDCLKDFKVKNLETLTTYELKKELTINRRKIRDSNVKAQKDKLKTRDETEIKDILKTFKSIRDKTIEPSTARSAFFEWNVWRAMTMINHGDIQGNFIVDDSGMPISTAAGRQSDIVGNYGEFDIGIEVTLSSGKKQYEMESEPVTRHIGEMQVLKPTFGLFIAQILNPSVVHHFYTISHQNSAIYNGTIDIIPMDIETFIEFFIRATNKDVQPNDLLSIHEHSTMISRQYLIDGRTEQDWHNNILEKAFEVVS